MQPVANIFIILVTFIGMEGAAWLAHKYLMHGIGWPLHRDHHVPEQKYFQRNDLFLLIFAIPSWLLIMFGSMFQLGSLLFVGLGIALYGICYFVVHDVFIHRRFPWWKNSNNFYLRAIRKAHKMHHKHLGKEDGECFGMLFVPWKYFREALDK